MLINESNFGIVSCARKLKYFQSSGDFGSYRSVISSLPLSLPLPLPSSSTINYHWSLSPSSMTTKDNRIIYRPVHTPSATTATATIPTATVTATACSSSGSVSVTDEDKTSSLSTSPPSSSSQTTTTTTTGICHPPLVKNKNKNKMHVSTDVVKNPRHISSDQDQDQEQSSHSNSSSNSNNSPTSYVTPPMSSSGTFDLDNGGTLLRPHFSDKSVEHLPSPINLRAGDGGYPANSNSGLVNTPNLFVKKVRAHYQQHQRLQQQQQEQKQKRTQSYYAGSKQNYADGDTEISGNSTNKNADINNDTNNINNLKDGLPLRFRPESRSASEFRAADFLNEKKDYDFTTIKPVQRVVSVPIQSPFLKEKELHLKCDHLDSDDESVPSPKLKLEDIHENKEVVVRPTTPVAMAAAAAVAAGRTLDPKAANGNDVGSLDSGLELDHSGAIKTTATTLIRSRFGPV
ncbi:unnamed protein product [Ambrosiozyma monospora]|uniref:Unnamed protein product n=1 Tax=Ambrosiozyma monospora TaxID=43982 RepID=A0ACB5T2Y8_AMBMO|nr:unnamed protein product [Ambrosiozyma monospora]